MAPYRTALQEDAKVVTDDVTCVEDVLWLALFAELFGELGPDEGWRRSFQPLAEGADFGLRGAPLPHCATQP